MSLKKLTSEKSDHLSDFEWLADESRKANLSPLEVINGLERLADEMETDPMKWAIYQDDPEGFWRIWFEHLQKRRVKH